MFKKKRFSKWIPFGINTYANVHYLVMGRKNLDNGIIEFKTIKIQRGIYSGAFVPYDIIDVKTQWNKLTEL